MRGGPFPRGNGTSVRPGMETQVRILSEYSQRVSGAGVLSEYSESTRRSTESIQKPLQTGESIRNGVESVLGASEACAASLFLAGAVPLCAPR